ncbi:MAG: alkaline phosphatase family protein, partial [Kofleriaceae bacterium]
MLTRREVLAGLGISAAAVGVVGCNNSGRADGVDGGGGDDAVSGADAEIDAPPDACTASSTMTPAQLLLHVETIVVLCMENRSFDHYLGSLRLAESR